MERKCKKRRKVNNKSEWGGRKGKSCDNVPCDFFYNIPNSKLLTLMIVIAIVISVVLLIIFKKVIRYCEVEKDANETVSNYLSLVALPVGVVLAFIASSAWSTFSDAQFKENQEATQILVLYNAVRQIPGSEDVQQKIKDYLNLIVDVEFPLMQQGLQSQEGTTAIFEIGNMIYQMDIGDDTKNSIIYSQIIDVYEMVVELRIARMTYVVDGLAPEMWWVLVLGVAVVIMVSFFVCSFSLCLQAVLTAFAVTALVSMLFLIIALNFPYRGDFGLDSLPFEIALYQIGLEEAAAENDDDTDC